MKDVVTFISVGLSSALKTLTLYNLTSVLWSLFFFFLKFGQNLGCVLHLGAHYTQVNTVLNSNKRKTRNYTFKVIQFMKKDYKANSKKFRLTFDNWRVSENIGSSLNWSRVLLVFCTSSWLLSQFLEFWRLPIEVLNWPAWITAPSLLIICSQTSWMNCSRRTFRDKLDFSTSMPGTTE